MSKYADEGSIAHLLFSMCLTENTDAAAYIGRVLEGRDYPHALLSASGGKKWIECAGSVALEAEYEKAFVERTYSAPVTEEMATAVQISVDGVRSRIEEYKLAGAKSVEVLVDQRVTIGHITGEGAWYDRDGERISSDPQCPVDLDPEYASTLTWRPATGTGDVILIVTWEDDTVLVEVIDLKFGMGVVVPAENNVQLLLYALGALEDWGVVHDIVTLRLSITQPRVKVEFSEWTIGRSELEKFGEEAAAAAKTAMFAFFERGLWATEDAYLKAGDHCANYFCKARATCPALAKYVLKAVDLDDFGSVAAAAPLPVISQAAAHYGDDAAELSAKMTAADAIEDWLKAVRAEVERRLLAGIKVPGFKLVQGRKGNRAWSSEEEAVKQLKSFRLKHDQMYHYKVISPPDAEKLVPEIDKKTKKPKVGQEDRPLTPKQWEKLVALIKQAEGKPSVAPESDKRPALDVKPPADDFTNDETADESLAG